MPRQCHVVHRLPGRIRFKAPEAKGDPLFFHHVRELVSSVDGVYQVEANPVTGSVVVRYDRNERDIEQRLQRALEDENKLLSFVVPKMEDVAQIARFVETDLTMLANRSRVAAALVDGARTLNLLLKRATNNTVDLQILFPVAFAAISLFFIDRRREPGLWIMLLFVSFHTFLTLQQPVTPMRRKPVLAVRE